MRENLDIFDFELTDDQVTRIAAMDTRMTLFFDHRDPRELRRLGARLVD
jgi:2,5-diketo-D-gluconate reductase A